MCALVGASTTLACTGFMPGAGGTTRDDGNDENDGDEGGSKGHEGGAGGDGGNSGGSGAGNAGGAYVPPPPPTDPSLLPLRVRRLSNFEYDRTIAALLGTTATPARGFAADFRQSDFTSNAAQQVDAVYAAQLELAAKDLAREATPRIVGAAGCAPTQGETCAAKVIESFGLRAYRRPLTTDEKTGLLNVWKAGSNGATFNDGVELVLIAMLQSPNLLYLTELGEGAPKDGVVRLGDYEIAAELAYTLTASPPDAELLAAAAARKLGDAAERTRHAKRLLGTQGARAQVQRLVKEWLGLDRIESTGKNKQIYPRYDELRPAMLAEADAFIEEVVWKDDGSLGKLLSADYTMAPTALAQFYGLSDAGTTGRKSLTSTGRRGLLTQAGFLAVHGHDHESAPVKRGTTILKKVLCVTMPQPGELNLMIIPPAPDPNKTTRDRFAQHASDPACAACHKKIDPIGFALEGFDGMGGFRTTENGRAVDTSATLALPEMEGPVKDAAELVAKLANADATRACFARNLFRFGAAQTGEGYEALFLEQVWNKLAPGAQTNVQELLTAFVASDLFVNRRVP